MRITSNGSKISQQASIEEEPSVSPTQSYIPKLATNPSLQYAPAVTLPPSTPTKVSSRSPRSPAHSPNRSPARSPESKQPFLSRDSNTRAPIVFDTKARMDEMEKQFEQFRNQMQSSATESQDRADETKARLAEAEEKRKQLGMANTQLKSELEETRQKLSTSETNLDTTRRNYTFELDDMRRKHRNEVDDLESSHLKEVRRLKQDLSDEAERARKDGKGEAEELRRAHKEEVASLEARLKMELEQERSQRLKEVSELQTEAALHRQNAGSNLEQREKELQDVRNQLERKTTELEHEKALTANLKDKLSEAMTANLTLESTSRAIKAKVEFLESDNKQQSNAFADLHKQMDDARAAEELAKSKLRAEETLRRKLHNQVQELKGNIRVFCRVRPAFESEAEAAAQINFPDAESDSKEVALIGPEQKSAMGTVTRSANAFSFDRVFGPSSQNAEVFEEISQLVQSALDGYNVCIFCYGQTGSGKTHTMSSLDGMIPRAVNQIYTTAKELGEKGWTYSMQGSFVEVYNENLNDLLGEAGEFDKKKHEIRHDLNKKQTHITDITTVDLDSPDRVIRILEKASTNRSVAATMANSRSSRSHSVFILKLKGENHITGERSEGTLNLVDLAGSERLSHSGATGERLKETQNINRSLSCLGDVIGALGQGKEGGHVPYRNSKLTYLLQFSLGGNSKTLMFVMISPLAAHLHETLTSLKFATKVHNTHIGTAKRQARVKD
ncbi:carboxy-terminal kinesin 2 [Saccharata proteae CBS 121410]|uniref:Kinesin-like protein n=1 Tax=Saccharata proteae CBS 121410 TaxID=1314787 RepID=A0A9P4LXT0_9PEZI|nr:carboxy-terminal kinesin 2 [Saccharata proteae CBS 121410]